MSNPEITVLMALYNGGLYLKMAIESVLAQTYQDFEFLIVNDCSTDNSIELIRSYNDSRIRIYTNKKNLGQTQSLNVGLKEARGRYVARIDADDYVFPQWLERHLEMINTYPGFAVISADALVIDENNKIRQSLILPKGQKEMILNSLMRSPLNHVGSIFEKDTIINVGGYNPSFRISADYDLWSRLLRNGYKLYVAENILTAIRIHERSLSRSSSETEIFEMTNVAKENICHFVNKEVGVSEIENLMRTYYAEDGFSISNLDQAVLTLEKITKLLIQNKIIDKFFLQDWGKKQIKFFLVKCLFREIRKGQTSELRALASLGISKFGFFSIFSVISVMCLLGASVASSMPSLYNFFVRYKTKWYLFRNSKVKLFV